MLEGFRRGLTPLSLCAATAVLLAAAAGRAAALPESGAGPMAPSANVSSLTASAAGSGSCRTVDDAAVVAQRKMTSSGVYSHSLWRTEPATATRADTLRRALQTRFGVSTKFDPMAALRAGLVGTTIDHRQRRFVVVVGRGTGAAPVVRREVSRAFAASRGTRGGAPFVVVESCRSAADLYAAYQVLHARTWAPEAGAASLSFWLDPADSTWHVSIDPRYSAVVASLSKRLGALVSVTVEPVSRAGRMSDGEPHYGGAALGNKNDPFCSAGYIVKRSNGVSGGTTAGHCFANGVSVYSGDKYWGASGGKANYPLFDMMWVSSSGETYDNVIHTDPCCPSTRTVTSGGDASVGTVICASGMVTKAVCGITVKGLDGELC